MSKGRRPQRRQPAAPVAADGTLAIDVSRIRWFRGDMLTVLYQRNTDGSDVIGVVAVDQHTTPIGLSLTPDGALALADWLNDMLEELPRVRDEHDRRS